MKTKKASIIELEDVLVRVEGPGEMQWEDSPIIYHEISAPTSHGFVDRAGAFMSGSVSHSFTMAVPVDQSAECYDPNYDEQAFGVERDLDAILAAGFDVADAMDRGDHTKEVVVARMHAKVFSDFNRSLAGVSWFEWLDAIDGEMSEVGAFADTVYRNSDDFEGDLIGGSLIYVKGIAVHPKFRGQDLGLRLLAHALLKMTASNNDVAVLLAADCPVAWDDREQDLCSSRARKLAAHYRRLGFKKGEAGRIGDSVLMYLPVGRLMMNIDHDLYS